MDHRERAEQVFERCHLVIFRYVRAMTGRQDDAEDVTQEAFLRLLRSGERVTRGDELPWLLHVARNLLTDQYRRRHKMPLGGLDEASHLGEPPRQALRLDLAEAVDRLPPADREVFVLREWVGLSYVQIADICGVSHDAVNGRLRRARQALQGMLADQGRFAAGPVRKAKP
jgi:RNA polymerase sigma-70 factor (ECF subfamily)